MPKFPPPVTTLSGLEIDADKDWATRRIENLGAPTGDGHAARRDTGINRLTADETVTVGAAGDYATINEALAYLSEKYPLYVAEGYTAEIQLLAGFTMAEQVLVQGIDLGWIKITSAEPEQAITAFADGGVGFTEVTIAGHGYANGDVVFIAGTTNYNGAHNVSDVAANTFKIDITFVVDDAAGTSKKAVNITRSALTTVFVGSADYPVFGALQATLPVIGALFNMDESGASGSKRHFCLVAYNSKVYIAINSGCKNASGLGLAAWYSSYASCNDLGGNAIFSGAKCIGNPSSGAIDAVTSVIRADVANADDSGCEGIRGDRASIISFWQGSAQRATRNGIRAARGTTIFALQANADDAGENGVWAGAGSVIKFSAGSAQRAGWSGVYASIGSTVVASRHSGIDTNVSDAGAHGLWATDASTIAAAQIIAPGAGDCGAHADGGSRISAYLANLSGATTNGIFAAHGSSINAQGANARKGGVDDPTDIRLLRGSFINANAATGGVSTPVNTLSVDGAIFR